MWSNRERGSPAIVNCFFIAVQDLEVSTGNPRTPDLDTKERVLICLGALSAKRSAHLEDFLNDVIVSEIYEAVAFQERNFECAHMDKEHDKDVVDAM